jgi:RNA polymerase sigma factor (sigma-70 family)
VLRRREALKPGGNFPAYLTMIATNLWRDQHRGSQRAGEMAPSRMASLDFEIPSAEGTLLTLAEALPDLHALEAEARAKMKLDIDDALARLTPLSRDVLVARFLDGESCAEIGRRYDRTEQAVSGWIRRAIQEMKSFLCEAPHGTP